MKRTRKPKRVPVVTVGHIRKDGGTVMYDRTAKRFTTTAGRAQRARSVEGLIARGVLMANGDGLFPGMSQTYRLVEGA